MPDNCSALVAQYMRYLEAGFQVEPVEVGCTIVTPFTNPIGDHIELFVGPAGDGEIIISDQGAALDYLYLAGMSLENVLRHPVLRSRLEVDGLTIRDEQLIATCRTEDGPRSMHRLVRAILALEYLQYTARPRGGSSFRERVIGFTKERGLSVDEHPEVPGALRVHRFDLAVNHRKDPTYGRTFSTTSPQYAHNLAVELLYAVADINKRIRDQKFPCIAVVDDERELLGAAWKDESCRIITDHAKARLFRWSQREQMFEFLAPGV